MEIDKFLEKFGFDTTSNFDLEDFAEELGIPNFFVLMKDELKDLAPKANVNVICNLHTTKQNGIHWSCFSTKHKVFFDSYGWPPLKEVDNIMPHGTYSIFKLQDFWN